MDDDKQIWEIYIHRKTNPTVWIECPPI
jgi:hypothetical protein